MSHMWLQDHVVIVQKALRPHVHVALHDGWIPFRAHMLHRPTEGNQLKIPTTISNIPEDVGVAATHHPKSNNGRWRQRRTGRTEIVGFVGSRNRSSSHVKCRNLACAGAAVEATAKGRAWKSRFPYIASAVVIKNRRIGSGDNFMSCVNDFVSFYVWQIDTPPFVGIS